MPAATGIALVSLGTTPGLVRSDESFVRLVRAAGVDCEVVRVRIGASGRLRRQTAVTDLVEAVAARRSARGLRAGAIVYSTVTAALLQRPLSPYAIRFDATAALNRPGASGAWQRVAERRALARARLLMPLTEAALPQTVQAPVVTLPIPIEEIAPASRRDIDAVAYAGYPRKRGLELLCDAWAQAAPPGAKLLIGGADREKGLRWLERSGRAEPAGVEWAGELPRSQWLDRVARARVFLNASRWEDFGLAPLEALAAGALLVTVPTPGPFAALALARRLDPRLVAADLSGDALARALRVGLSLDEGQARAYADNARTLLEPYREAEVARVLAQRVLPALGLR
ncbi:MAG: hypothetical protein NVSMB25_03010 [Thermoleophilaceae bacterium]